MAGRTGLIEGLMPQGSWSLKSQLRILTVVSN